MKKNLFYIFLIFLNILALTVSCSNNKDELENENSQNEAFVGTKWVLTDWDYSLGDDYIGTHNYTINVYFYSETEGLVYYGQKDNYSDLGSSDYRAVSHFNFKVNGNMVELDYITSKISEAPFLSFTIAENEILANGMKLQRNTISNDDYDWLATLHGETGKCSWYHDLQNMLYVVGEGEMADYTSFEATPWANRAFNVLKIGEGVTSIGNNAFNCKSLGEVTLPSSSLLRIGNNAFGGSCISEVNLGDNIMEIGDKAFSDCLYLYQVNLPANIETIGSWAFSNCKSINLSDTKKLKKIGDYAFYGCKVNGFTDSEVLEEVGAAAFTNLVVNELVLPNSLSTIGHLSFCGSFTEIRIGTGLSEIIGTPFFPASTGKIYVNLVNPLPLTCPFLDATSGWTLYVPEGCRTAYSQTLYWKDFKNIIEDNTLTSGNEQPDGSDTDNDTNWGDNSNIVIPETYSNAGKTYKWIRVESSTIPTFYIMQTELDASSHFRIGDNGDIGLLNITGGIGVTKAMMKNFLDKIEQVTGIQMRIPTREEWMYAAKGGNKSMGYTYSGSNDIDQVAWYSKNSYSRIQNFAQKQPNELGIYDMSGNYAELTNDNVADYANVDGYFYGGCSKDGASACTVTSGKPGIASGDIPGSTYKEKNAYDTRYITVRLVFTAPY